MSRLKQTGLDWSYSMKKKMIRELPDWLAHHGVQGQKWGVKNGPPYPIGSGPKGGSYLGENINR